MSFPLPPPPLSCFNYPSLHLSHPRWNWIWHLVGNKTLSFHVYEASTLVAIVSIVVLHFLYSLTNSSTCIWMLWIALLVFSIDCFLGCKKNWVIPINWSSKYRAIPRSSNCREFLGNGTMIENIDDWNWSTHILIHFVELYDWNLTTRIR